VATPYFDNLVEQGSMALMNCKTAGTLEPKDTYLTIGSGERATAGKAGFLNFNLTEQVKAGIVSDVYARRVGDVISNVEVANIRFGSLERRNLQSDYQAQVGQLTASLTEIGKQVVVLGNADTWEQSRRQIALIGINSQGLAQGDVGSKMVRKAPKFPGGYLTDQDYLMKKLDFYWPDNDLFIIESGDTSRLEAVSDSLTAIRYREAKKRAIKRADKLLGRVIERLDLTKDYLMVATPTPAGRKSSSDSKLTLTLLAGPGMGEGLLTSGTTKRSGVVTNIDLAPTIYDRLIDFETEQSNFTGQPLEGIPAAGALDYLTSLAEKIQRTFSWRPKLVRWFIGLQIITVSLSGLVLIYRKKITFIKQIVTLLLVSSLWLPSFFLLSQFFLAYRFPVVVSLWIGLSLLWGGFTLRRWSGKLLPILLPGLVFVGLLAVDLWGSSNWVKLSVFGYSPVIGARFYGLGNEFMGMLTGAGIMSLCSLLELKKITSHWQVLSWLGILVATIGFPTLGANFGGLITSSAVAAFVYLNLEEEEINWKLWLQIGLIAISGVVAIIIMEKYNLIGVKTHVGRLLTRISRQGIGELILVIYRKLEMNLKLLRWTIWSRVLLAFMAVLVILFKWPQGRIKHLIVDYPYLTVGFKGTLLGSIVVMGVNDSGVVAAATLLLFPVFILLYLVVGEEEVK
jgi:hypothetical protein